MNIAFECPDKVSGLMTVTLDEKDYSETVDAQIKELRKKAKVPGFRPGMVPKSMIQRMYGTSVKADVVNKLVGEEIYKYVNEHKISMLGSPLPSEKQTPQDLEKDSTLTFVFDIAVAPELNAHLTEKDKIEYYAIKVDDSLIDRQVDMFASRSGSYVKAEEYEENDMLKGDLRELDAEGNTLEGGVAVSEAIVMPTYLRDAEQKKLFDGSKLGDILTVSPRKMYGDTEMAALLKLDKDEALKHDGNFSYQITEISRYQKAPVDQKLFDSVYGEGTCADETAFRQKIADGLKPQLQSDSDFKFLSDVRAYLEKRVGKPSYPDALMKRIMLESAKDKDMDYVEKNYEGSLKELTWHLMKEQLVADCGVKVGDSDLEAAAIEAARVQFAQYGMNNVPEEYLKEYSKRMLETRESREGILNRAVDVKLIQALKNVVKLKGKEVTLDEFNALMDKK